MKTLNLLGKVWEATAYCISVAYKNHSKE